MLYLNEESIQEVGIDWKRSVEVIREAVVCLANNEFAQPIKPYLRYNNLKNRIIAMPAYVGGECDMAGIKWIASYPDNINHGIARAHSVVVLNNSETGIVEAIINTPLLSIIRTAAVTGFFIEQVSRVRNLEHCKVGIIGLGPIGQNHLKMCTQILGNMVEKYYLYDIRPVIDIDNIDTGAVPVMKAKTWDELYEECDIIICCTVAEQPYINKKPKEGALVLNISLRDFTLEAYPYLKNNIIVDDWEEVCREKTTIEDWNKAYGLQREDTHNLVDLLTPDYILSLQEEDTLMFCPMGMAVFDIAIATYYYNNAKRLGIGVDLV